MAAPSAKRRKTKVAKETSEYPVKYPHTVLFIVERDIQRFRLNHIKNLARKKGFLVSEEINGTVTHIVSELDTREKVFDVLKPRLPNEVESRRLLETAEIVSMRWFSSCMEEGAPIDVTYEHRLKSDVKVVPSVSQLNARPSYQDAKYACQRITPMKHHNKQLTDALEVLEKQADFRGGDVNASRALAFRKASAALKALPRKVRRMAEVDNLCDLKGGKHCKRVIQEILEEGFCSEVEGILNDEWFKTMKIFTGVFGCGAATARKWFDMNLRNLEDVRNCPNITLTTEQKYGLELYDDINTPVTRQDADIIESIVSAEVQKILPGASVTITGGFSRGKETGHDVDLLISHPEEGREEGLLPLLLNALRKNQLLEYTDVQNSSYNESAVRQVRRNQTMDHFERCFSIFRLPRELRTDSQEPDLDRGTHNETEERTISHSETTKDTQADDIRHEQEETAGFSYQSNIHAERSNAVTQQQNDVSQNSSLAPSQVKQEMMRCHGNIKDADQRVRGQSETERTIPMQKYWRNSESVERCEWLARRVDFIISPKSQYSYALLGWIGSRMFNRSMRDYANKEMNMTLTSHGLYDKTNSVFVPAKDQKEIFASLKLDYREPHERNC